MNGMRSPAAARRGVPPRADGCRRPRHSHPAPLNGSNRTGTPAAPCPGTNSTRTPSAARRGVPPRANGCRRSALPARQPVAARTARARLQRHVPEQTACARPRRHAPARPARARPRKHAPACHDEPTGAVVAVCPRGSTERREKHRTPGAAGPGTNRARTPGAPRRGTNSTRTRRHAAARRHEPTGAAATAAAAAATTTAAAAAAAAAASAYRTPRINRRTGRAISSSTAPTATDTSPRVVK
jgi:hypothetical protein